MLVSKFNGVNSDVVDSRFIRIKYLSDKRSFGNKYGSREPNRCHTNIQYYNSQNFINLIELQDYNKYNAWDIFIL